MIKKDKMKNTFLDILYPRRCPVCHDIPVPGTQKICSGCRERLRPVTGPRCFKCSKPLKDPEQEYCSDCSRRTHLFDQGIGIFPYNTLLQESLFKLKYGKRQEYGVFYGELAAAYAEAQIRCWEIDYLVPIPLHRKRLEKRGYNQAELIAEALGKRVNLPVKKKLMKRKINTKPQKDLNPEERLKNIWGAFTAAERLNGGNILLIDDIYTTGATLNQAAATLKKAGAQRVYFLVIAIGSET